MKKKYYYLITSALYITLGFSAQAQDRDSLQAPLPDSLVIDTVSISHIKDIPLLDGYVRLYPRPHSYAAYLQNFPLKKDTLVYLHNGNQKEDQSFSYRVLDIDVGEKNLQQCADAAIRLRAEYLYQQQRYDEIHFNFSSGDTAFYTSWRVGYRPLVQGRKVTWVKEADPDSSYANFRDYLNTIFNYAGSWSLDKELDSVIDPHQVQIGDMLVRGGFPGHVMLVVDMAQHLETGGLIFLLAQSARPAQDIHVVKNRQEAKISPWYRVETLYHKLEIEEWTFYKDSLKRF